MQEKKCENCFKSSVCKYKDTFMEEEKKIEKGKYDWLDIELNCHNYFPKDSSFIPISKPQSPTLRQVMQVVDSTKKTLESRRKE